MYVSSDIYCNPSALKTNLFRGSTVRSRLRRFPRRRIETGFLLRRLQQGEKLSMPQSRPMPSIAASCHELRVNDEGRTWRLTYRLDADAILILAVFAKKTEKTPDEIIRICRKRLRDYHDAS
jgi:phage-related protein